MHRKMFGSPSTKMDLTPNMANRDGGGYSHGLSYTLDLATKTQGRSNRDDT